jgi:histidinol-phosphate phosphatase family protein
VFLDRVGTLVRDVRHSADPAALEWLPGVAEGLAALAAAGYRLVVVTNQSGAARGLFTIPEARAVGRHVAGALAIAGVRLSGYYLCPHYPSGAVPALAVACHCRKPRPGLLFRAARALGIDLRRSWMIGDAPSDVRAGQAAGVRPILLDNGSLGLSETEAQTLGALVARNVAHAAAIVLALGSEPSARADELRARADAMGLAPLSPAVLVREPPLDARRTGDPSQWPDARRLVEARADARALAELARTLQASAR